VVFLLVLLFVVKISTKEVEFCSSVMSTSRRENCLKDKIYSKIPSDKIYKISFSFSAYKILITTYYFENDYQSFTYLDGLTISYESKNPGRAPGSPPCTESRRVCSDGTVIYANKETCQFPSCYFVSSSPPKTTSPEYCQTKYKYCPDGSVLYANINCQFVQSCPSSLVSTWVYWLPILVIVAVVLFSFIIFMIILRRYRQRQALEGLNEDVQTTTNSSEGGSNYFMRTNNIASTQPAYLYQPNSSIMTNGPIPTGYVPVLQTNIQPSIPLSSDEIFARELQTKFDQGY